MGDNATIQNITANDLHDKIIRGADIRIIDNLPHDFYKKGHLPSALNACVFEMTFVDQIKKLVPDKQQRVIIYGASKRSMDAETAAEKMIRAGYTDVSVLSGGIEEWQDCGYSLEGENQELVTRDLASSQLTNGTYTIDTKASLIEWFGRNPNTKHHGTIRLSQGNIKIENGEITGRFVIDMHTINNVNLKGDELKPVLEAHLKSDDFFFVDYFPETVFKIENATPIETAHTTSPNYTVKGMLSLKGVRAGLDFLTTVHVLPDGKLTAEAHFDLDRTRWKIIYGSINFSNT